MNKSEENNIIIITGLSGAGKTIAIQALEDLGFFCIDNLPPQLIPEVIDFFKTSGNNTKIALVADLRGGQFFNKIIEVLTYLNKTYKAEFHILFLEADDKRLIRRYKSSRRKHPLMVNGSLLEVIAQERVLLKDIKECANNIIDTTHLKNSQLKEKIICLYGDATEDLAISFMSFGFKHGIPIDADLVLDVRFLPNPYYVSELCPLSGEDESVYDYVLKWDLTQTFLEKTKDLLQFLIPNYKKEGKSHLIIAIGCTGGRHRSVAITKHLYNFFSDKKDITIRHRDILKGDYNQRNGN